MPESRDRLYRSDNDIAEMLSRRQTIVGSIGILPDVDDSERSIIQTPFRWGATPLSGDGSGQRISEVLTARAAIRGGAAGRGLFGTPLTVNRRGGRNQNTPPSGSSFRRGRGGGSGPHSVLPSWYPRTPLRDITHVVRAIERRREHLGDGAGSVLGSPIPITSAQLEHEQSLVTPNPKLACKTFQPSTLGKIPVILTSIASKVEGDSDSLTPQKKLLASIDLVEKVVMDELNRLKRTPTAKKAEREKKMRTLMSMR